MKCEAKGCEGEAIIEPVVWKQCEVGFALCSAHYSYIGGML